MQTQTVTFKNVHNRFKLNGCHLNREDLCRIAYSFIKEGSSHEKPVGDFILNWFDDNEFMEVKTSGTTGEPKVIRLSKQAMVNSALATGDFFDIGPGSKALHCLPVAYIAGKMMFIRAFILGLELDFTISGSKPLENNHKKYDFAAMVPMQAQYSLGQLYQIKKLIIGGAKITHHLEQELVKIPTEIYETYGMTETITHIAAKRVGEKEFFVLPGVQIKQDLRQCLVIEAPAITDTPIVTNDLVEITGQRSFIWKGRIDHVINSGGVKLLPESIEDKLVKRISQRYIITGEPDPVLGERVVLLIEGEPIDLESTVFDDLEPYEKPKKIYFVKHFEETPNGKIIRKTTAEKFFID